MEMEWGNPPILKQTIYGEGAVHPLFIGSIYMKDDKESHEKAAWRFNEAMKAIGFEWIQGLRKPL